MHRKRFKNNLSFSRFLIGTALLLLAHNPVNASQCNDGNTSIQRDVDELVYTDPEYLAEDYCLAMRLASLSQKNEKACRRYAGLIKNVIRKEYNDSVSLECTPTSASTAENKPETQKNTQETTDEADREIIKQVSSAKPQAIINGVLIIEESYTLEQPDSKSSPKFIPPPTTKVTQITPAIKAEKEEETVSAPSSNEVYDAPHNAIHQDYIAYAVFHGRWGELYREAAQELGKTNYSSRRALTWFTDAARAGNREAQYHIGYLYDQKKPDYNKAIEFYELAAEQEHPKALNNLGNMYAYGKGVQRDINKAIHFWEKAARQGSSVAGFNIGRLHELGHGTEKNYNQAIAWYQTAAYHQHAHAAFKLGYFYDNGIGVSEDNEQAIKYYEIAAENNLIEAQYNLAVMYATGDGTPKDRGKMLKWLRRASELGDRESRSLLKQMDDAKAIKEIDRTTNVVDSKIQDQMLFENGCTKDQRLANCEVTITYSDGRQYKGHAKNKIPNGYGQMTWESGDSYRGHYENGKKHGKGIYQFANGEEINAEWIAGLIKKELISVLPGYDVNGLDNRGLRPYQFEFTQPPCKSKKHRNKCYARKFYTVTFKQNEGRKYLRYEGEFLKRLHHGVGSLYHSDGGRYTGEWKESIRHGRGNEYRPKYAFIGTQKNGNRDKGVGILFFGKNDSISEIKIGMIKNSGALYGIGTKYFSDGKIQTGKWVNNRLIN